MEFGEVGANVCLDRFAGSNLTTVRSKTAFLIGIIKRFRNETRAAGGMGAHPGMAGGGAMGAAYGANPYAAYGGQAAYNQYAQQWAAYYAQQQQSVVPDAFFFYALLFPTLPPPIAHHPLHLATTHCPQPPLSTAHHPLIHLVTIHNPQPPPSTAQKTNLGLTRNAPHPQVRGAIRSCSRTLLRSTASVEGYGANQQ